MRLKSSASRERRNVTAANGFLRFPDNRKISALASMARVVRAGPAQGWALEMQGIPMVFKGVQLIPGRRQGSMHSTARFLMMLRMRELHCSQRVLKVSWKL